MPGVLCRGVVSGYGHLGGGNCSRFFLHIVLTFGILDMTMIMSAAHIHLGPHLVPTIERCAGAGKCYCLNREVFLSIRYMCTIKVILNEYVTDKTIIL